MSVTLKYDEPEVENVAQGRSPSATFSADGHHCDQPDAGQADYLGLVYEGL